MKLKNKYKAPLVLIVLWQLLPTLVIAQDYPKLQNHYSTESIKVDDSYKILENGLKDNLKDWYDKQNHVALESLDKGILKKTRKDIFKIYPKGGNYFEMVIHAGGRMFYLEDRNLDRLDEIYAKTSGDKKGTQIFDARKYLGDDWKKYTLDYYQPSWDGQYIAVALKPKGESYSELVVVNCKSGKTLTGKIHDTDPLNAEGLTWGPNSKSFLVNHYTQSDKNHPEYHVTNETVLYQLDGYPDNATVVFNYESYNGIGKTENTNARLLSPEDNHVIGTLASVEWYTDGYIAEAKELFNGKLLWKPFFKREDKVEPIGFHNNRFYYISGKDLNRSLCSVPVDNPDYTSPELVVPAYKDRVIRRAAIGDGGLYLVTIKNGVTSKLLRYDFGKGLTEVSMKNDPGDIKLIKSSNTGPLYAMIYNWTKNYDRFLIEGEKIALHPLAYDMRYPMFDDLVFEEVEYNSHDGVKVPLSLVYIKGSKPNTNTPVFLYSYGVYGISVSPNFRDTWYSWAMNGGLVAFAHIRGGGEKGDAWHQAGKIGNKKNSWKDIIAAAEHLIDNKMTSNKKIALHTESGGAVSSGMAVNERPDLFGCFVVSKGVFNPQRFVESNLGKTNYREFGSIDIPEEKQALTAMDPFINIKKQDYPAIFTITALADERVPYWQTAKYIAKLQDMDTSKESPVVMRVLTEATHTNFGELSYNRAYSEIFTFCYQYLGLSIK